jgi:hypothetical protein
MAGVFPLSFATSKNITTINNKNRHNPHLTAKLCETIIPSSA